MYFNPYAQIISLGGIFSHIPLFKGTRQGCPLSHPSFLSVFGTSLKISDDFSPSPWYPLRHMWIKNSVICRWHVIFMSAPFSDLGTLQTVLDKFRSCSGFRVNYDKSKVLPLMRSTSSWWVASSHFLWPNIISATWASSSKFSSIYYKYHDWPGGLGDSPSFTLRKMPCS